MRPAPVLPFRMHLGLRLRFLLLFGIGLASSEVIGQTGEKPNGSTQLSAQVTDAVRAGLPKFQPPKATDTDAGEEQAALALPERKNKIIRLPTVVVEGERPPVFREQDIYTPEALADIAVKRYFSGFSRALNRFRLPLFGSTPEAYALARWRADERLRILNELENEIDLDNATGNTERAKELRKIINHTLSHEPLFLSPAHAPYRDARGQ
ncbi:MAG: hypothetical protein SynsKO_29750 [Synoicihabitans sp.]